MYEGRLCNFTDEESRVLISVWGEDKFQPALNGQRKNVSLQQGVIHPTPSPTPPLKVRMLRVCSCEMCRPVPSPAVSSKCKPTDCPRIFSERFQNAIDKVV
ncbi:UNVERIFIED_CONTAM: hypothetical protein FKN15_016721 [Acipenser sinensis]